MSTSPTPSQLPNATANTRGAVPHLDRSWGRFGTLVHPRWFAYSDFPVMIADGRLLVTGGAGFSFSATSEVIAADGKSSVATADAPNVRTEGHAGASIGTKTVAIGGTDLFGGTPIDAVDVWDSGTGLWTAGTAYPAGPVSRGRAIALNNGKILMTGGRANFFSGSPYSLSYLYDPVADSWTATGSLNHGRYLMPKLVRINATDIFISHGASNPFENTCEVYNETSGLWTLTANSAFSHSEGTATLLSTGRILVAGGVTNVLNKECEIYNPVADSWQTIASLNYPRQQHQCIALPNGAAMVFSGVPVGSVAIDLADLPAEIYDPVANAWTILGASPAWPATAGHCSSGHLKNTTGFEGIYAIGGFNSGFLSDQIHVYGANGPVTGMLSTTDQPYTGQGSISLSMGRVGDAILSRGFGIPQVIDPPNYTDIEPYVNRTDLLFRVRNAWVPDNINRPNNMQNLIQNGGMDFWQRGLYPHPSVHNDSAGVNTWSRSGADRFVMAMTDYNISFSGTAANFERINVNDILNLGYQDQEQVTAHSSRLTYTSFPYPPTNLIGLAGSSSFVNGSVIVTGTNTIYLSQCAPGKFVKLYFDSDAFYAEILSVDSDTQLTLVNPYGGSTGDSFTYQKDFLPSTAGEWAITQEIDRELVAQARGQVLRPDLRIHASGPNAYQLQFRLRIFTSDNASDIGQPLKFWISPLQVYDQFQSGFNFFLGFGGTMYWQQTNGTPTNTDPIGTNVVAMAIQLEVIHDTNYAQAGDYVEMTQWSLRNVNAYPANANQSKHPDFIYSAFSVAAEFKACQKYLETNVIEPSFIDTVGPPDFKNARSMAPGVTTYVPSGTVVKWAGSGAPVVSIFSPSTGTYGVGYDDGIPGDLSVSLDADGKITPSSPLTGTLLYHYLIEAEFPI